MKTKVIISVVALFISTLAMGQQVVLEATPTTSNSQPGQVVNPNAGTGIRKSGTRKSVAPVCTLPAGDVINVSFQAPSDDTSIYITDGNDLYFEAGMMVNETTSMDIPTNCLPKGKYYLIVADEEECYYQEFTVEDE